MERSNLEQFNLKQYGFQPDQIPNYMLMQVKIMARMVGPDLSEEDWVMSYSKPFREIIKTDAEIAQRIAEGDDTVLDEIITRLSKSPRAELASV
jgi:hypothetical protein